jgi:hypothetical protein
MLTPFQKATGQQGKNAKSPTDGITWAFACFA